MSDSNGNNGKEIVEIRPRDFKLVGIAFAVMLCAIGLLVFNVVQNGNRALAAKRQAAVATQQATVAKAQARAAKAQARTARIQAKTAAETHHGVCVFRRSLQQQATEAEKYLKQHPDGAPALGISAAQVQQGIDKQERAIHALASLHCRL